MLTSKLKIKFDYAKASAKHTLLTLKDDVKGLSGIEFAMIAPLLVGVFLGVSETALGVTNSRKVSRVAATLADLVSQSDVTSASQVDGIMNASSAVMEPFSSDTLKIFVIGVKMDANGTAKVAWSRARNDTAPAVDSPYFIPQDIRIPDTFLVVTNVTYDYTPSFGSSLIDTFHFDEKNYNTPRISGDVKCADCSP